MKVERERPVCPDCSAELELFPLLHHMMCAYVGPQYDFALGAEGYNCPKCRRNIASGDPACEIVGTSARCVRCGKEVVLPPSSTSVPG
jgi:uncharacterized protein with PIN domain